ncbi:MAG: serine/threonine protein kinase [Polyangiaceae bacterium]|nr:serine/threonine protein kinase [Polyangiaceae bacterium]
MRTADAFDSLTTVWVRLSVQVLKVDEHGEPRSRWTGRVLRGKWRIDVRIARGGVGTVYAATHCKNGSRVAIKVLHPQFSRDQDTRSRFLQEGYAANHVNHPGVVRILDDDVTEEGFAFLVMELLEGELLEARRVRKGGTLPLSEVYEVADQLLDVLASAHDKGIVHRDIKPDNLFVTSEGRLKVLDFGFAQMKSGFRQERTASGYLLGTPGFMAPEQAVGNRDAIDAQTDIWAVGATLFTLISGYPVHDAESAAAQLVAAANYQPRSLASVTSGLPLKLVQIVDRAIAFDKADRWPNARAMQGALRTVPGRPDGQMFESGRTSIPDHVPPPYDSDIELLEPSDIEEAPPQHNTDSEKPTLLATSPIDSRSAELSSPTLRDAQPPTQLDDFSPAVAVLPAATHTPHPEQAAPMGYGPSPQPPQAAPLSAPVGAPIGLPFSSPPSNTPAQSEARRRVHRARRVLLFLLVTLVSMVLVIIVGLAIFAALD